MQDPVGHAGRLVTLDPPTNLCIDNGEEKWRQKMPRATLERSQLCRPGHGQGTAGSSYVKVGCTKWSRGECEAAIKDGDMPE